MEFKQDNKIVKLCSTGMELEGQGLLLEAASLFNKAWNEAGDDFEKFTAAHYVARHQINISGKLEWDETALRHALLLGEGFEEVLPSLYLNIAKCHEDLKDFENAKKNYDAASSFQNFLPDNEYGKMIRTGIANGLNRIE